MLMFFRKRIFWKIFFTLLGVIVLAAISVAMVAKAVLHESGFDNHMPALAEVVFEDLPLTADRATLEPELAALCDRIGVVATVYDAAGTELASTTTGLPTPASQEFATGVFHADDERVGFLGRIGSTHWVAVAKTRPISHLIGFLTFFVPFLLVAALGCAFLANRIVRRLERLESSVSRWGNGELGVRATVRGYDEMARLGERFNAAADQVEQLIASHRRVAAQASHELRTPLARLRVAIDIIGDTDDREARDALVQAADGDIAELDELIAELLLRSKLDAGHMPRPTERIDVAEVIGAEVGRANAVDDGEITLDVAGNTVCVGDPTLLRHATRNLLDNARKHGAAPVAVSVKEADDTVVISVRDAGPGVEAGHEAKVFEPFVRAPRAASVPGTGLGLALVSDIASHHGGLARYVAESSGGRFELVLRRP